MPRQARLDAPGLLQHVMARGIERRDIFKDDKDRELFLGRLAIVLDETQTQCYAWALIPNHFHLLLRTGPTPLSKVMRRLMTGYAVTFNRRHKRSGHLFQNRYKSVVCEEDSYLLELIRYIHLNPLRVGLVNDLRELDKYHWAGHSAILGKRKNPLIAHLPNQQNKLKKPNKPSEREKPLAEKTIEDILLLFGNNLGEARKRYRHFVKQGVSQGTRSELQGGGLVRSAGGDKRALLGRKKEEHEQGDERILGSGDFVSEIIQKSAKRWEETTWDRIPLAALIQEVAEHMGISPSAFLSQSRDRNISRARAIISYLGAKEFGYTQTEIKSHLNISRIGVRNSILRAEKMLDTCQEIWEKIG
jgi:REP element-mobilizing transposase RayT